MHVESNSVVNRELDLLIKLSPAAVRNHAMFSTINELLAKRFILQMEDADPCHIEGHNTAISCVTWLIAESLDLNDSLMESI